MSYSPLAFTAPNYRDYKNNWIKPYEPGTPTPKSMATDSTLSTFIAKAEINVNGFIISAGGAIITPYIDGSYDLWMFPTEIDADNNDTSNAIRLADNITGVNGLAISAVENFPTLQSAEISTGLILGMALNIKERTAGNGGGAMWDVVLASSVTPNGIDIVQSTGVPSLALVMRETSKQTNMLLTNIKNSDLLGFDSVILTGADSVGDEEGEWYPSGVTIPGRAGTDELWQDAAYDVNGLEFKPVNKRAFVILGMGQSNMVGSTEAGGGDQTILDGVYAFNRSTRKYEVPQFGVNPLPSTMSNNAALQFANEIKRQTGRPCYFLINAQGGYSIDKWIGAGTGSEMWTDLTGQLLDADINANNKVDAVLWLQGEADGNDQATAYNSYGTYKAGIETLFAQLQALPGWSQETKFISGGIGEWNDHPNPERNDVNQTLNNNDDFPWAFNVGTVGLIRNPDVGQESHFDGNSLVTLAQTMAERYLGNEAPETNIGPNNQYGPYIYGVVGSGVSLTLDRDKLKSNCTLITNNGIITIPPKPLVWDGATLTVDVTSTALGRAQVLSPDTDIEWMGLPLPNSLLLNRTGAWVFLSSQGKLKLIERPKLSSTSLSFQNGTFTPSFFELEDEHYTSVNATINLPEPSGSAGAANNRTGLRFSVAPFSITGGSTIIGIDGGATGKFKDATGAIVNSLTLAAVGNRIELVMQGGFYFVSSQNF